jgi:hypothetical protein
MVVPAKPSWLFRTALNKLSSLFSSRKD